MICTARLQLHPCDLQHFAAFSQGDEALAQVLQATVPERWTEFPEALFYFHDAVKTDRTLVGWTSYLFVHTADQMLIGWGGFKGKPTAEGTVEIGYEIIPAYRQQGLATEAAQGLIDYALTQPQVKAIEAKTLPETNPSTRILEKLGLKCIGTIVDPDDGEIWHWRLERPHQ